MGPHPALASPGGLGRGPGGGAQVAAGGVLQGRSWRWDRKTYRKTMGKA